MTLLKVMVVDDSVFRRQQLTALIESTGLARVAGTANNGGEAIRLLKTLQPDVITLDLEMPGIDGFSFLRLMMTTRPTPVIVVSSNNRRDAVFKALEMGALDFIAAPEGRLDGESNRALTQKLHSIRAVRLEHLSRAVTPAVPVVVPRKPRPAPVQRLRRPNRLVAIGASTGGPTALTQVISSLPETLRCAILVAQHMPATFTAAFADRLNRYSRLEVHHAMDGTPIQAGHVYVCPGHSCMEVRDEGELRVSLHPPSSKERYVPSVNRLLSSVAQCFGPNSVGVVLTGMGDDGATGAEEVERMGGRVIAEAESTAVVFGMPRAVLAQVSRALALPLDEIAGALERVDATSPVR